MDEKGSKMRKTAYEARQQAGNGGRDDTEEQKRRRKAEQKVAKRERKRARVEKAKEKRERQKARKQAAVANEPTHHDAHDQEEEGEAENGESGPEGEADMVEGIDITGEHASMVVQPADPSSASPSPVVESPILSPQPHSTSSSISSIIPAPEPGLPPKTSQPQPSTTSNPTGNDEASSKSAKERLEARLAELRAARKADGPEGRRARNRQELLEMRRKKEEERRAQTKEQRRKAKEEEARKQEEEIARHFSPGGSGSLLASPRSPMEPSNNFSFGRVAFGDGSQADPTLSSVTGQRKHKGPADPASALRAVQSKMSRLAGLDDAKRADIEQKDMWLKAKKRAHGERVRDDTSLLKKALKRQEGAKQKSEKEWMGRLEGVARGQEIRQRKREENLRKRKEDKASKGKKNKSKKPKRPGFEGSFKGRTGGGKKNKA
jgi:hypothetical protein